MNKASILTAFLLLAVLFPATGQPDAADSYPPHATYLFAQKDGQDLYMDDYLPAEGSRTTLDGRRKPAIVFVFGGGFITGARNDAYYKPWFKALNDEGYRVFSIDYRLGMKGIRTKGGVSSFKQFYDAVQLSADDLFSATAYLVSHAGELDVDPDNLVLSGSSAGAMTVLQADWILSCRGSARPAREGFTPRATHASVDLLPEGFRYAGVMSFAGAVLSRQGMPDYPNAPAPTLLLHGTADKIVNYRKIHVLNIAFTGSDALEGIFRKNGFPCSILRYDGHAHEIAAAFLPTLPDQLRFLETVVVHGKARRIDALVDDPDIPQPSGMSNRKELYSGK